MHTPSHITSLQGALEDIYPMEFVLQIDSTFFYRNQVSPLWVDGMHFLSLDVALLGDRIDHQGVLMMVCG
jgi:hypothetical protein